MHYNIGFKILQGVNKGVNRGVNRGVNEGGGNKGGGKCKEGEKIKGKEKRRKDEEKGRGGNLREVNKRGVNRGIEGVNDRS